jgi:hypothetical protein
VSLSAAQIEQVREVIDYTSLTATTVLCASLTAEQETATVTDLDLWDTVKDDNTRIEKGLLGANIDPEVQRLQIRNRVRVRLGLPRITAETLSAPVEIAYSHPDQDERRWCRRC